MLGQTIGEVLPLALVIALSPIPLVGVILILFSPRAGANSWMFLLGWVAGVLGGAVVVLVIANTQDLTTSSRQPDDSVSTIHVVLGALLILLAYRQWQKRPKHGQAPPLPRYLQAVGTLTPVKTFGVSIVLAAVNPKNLVMLIAAGLEISSADLSDGDQAVAVAVFTVIAVSTVVAVVLGYQLLGERVRPALDSLRGWLVVNNSTVMAVLLLVIGTVVLGRGLGVVD
ncbi:MAG TPA: GAP family protein [Acidimicrobiia bacterium]